MSNVKEIRVSDPQAEILSSLKTRNLFLAGIGSGKTYSMGILSAEYIINYPKTIGLVAANTYQQLTKSTLKGIFECWLSTFGWVNGVEYVVDKIPPKHYKMFGSPLKSYENTICFNNGGVIFTASLDNYKVLDGTELGYALLDETKDTKEEAIKDVIIGRLRQKSMYIKDNVLYDSFVHGAVGFNPLYVFTSPAKVYWINEWFGLSDKYEEISTKIFSKTDFYTHEDEQRKVVISSSWHNEDNLPEGYIDGLIKDFTGNQDKIDMLIYGSPIAKSGGELFSQFNRLTHVKFDLGYNDSIPLHISFDFNVAPYITCLISQIERIEDKYVVRFIDELCLTSPKNNTEALTKEFVSKYLELKKNYVFYYGDASGSNRSTLSIEHNYDVIRRVLHKYINDNSDRVIKRNPSVSKSRSFINKLLAGGYSNIEIQISSVCVNLIKDLEFLKEAPDGGKLIEKVKDSRTGQTYEKLGHCSDAFTYELIAAFGAYYDED